MVYLPEQVLNLQPPWAKLSEIDKKQNEFWFLAVCPKWLIFEITFTVLFLPNTSAF